MNPKVSGLLIGIIVAACFATGALVYPHLPAVGVAHWNAQGEPNGSSSRLAIAFILPGVLLLLYGLWALLPKIDPLNKGFRGFRHVYDFFWILLSAFLAYVYSLMLLANLGGGGDFFPQVMRALGAFFFVAGLLLPMVKRNWFFGIRTPWTISSDDDWRKTHRLGGVLFCLAGAILFAASFFSRALTLELGIGSVIAAALISAAYSYVIYPRAPRP
jgi:uncharacterized membrane protein